MRKLGNPKLFKRVAARVQELREERELSQADVLNDTGIHIARIEQGTKDISLSTLEALCEYFGISFVDFFKGMGKE